MAAEGAVAPAGAPPGSRLSGGRGPTAGVVIPCWNYGRYLPEAVESALAQTYPASEIVVVDDGSTDDTAEVAGRYRDPVRYIRVPRGGVSAARNRGAREVSSDFVVFLDADDVLHPQFLEKTLEAVGPDPQRCYVYTDAERFGADTGVIVAGEFSVRRLARSNFVHASALMPTDLIRQYGYRSSAEAGMEDWDLYLTLAEQGVFGRYVASPLLRYRHHDRGRTRLLREHPFRLAALRLQLARDHASLYSAADTVGYLAHVAVQLRVDLAPRERLVRFLVQPGRRERATRKLRALRPSRVARGARRRPPG